MKGPTASKFSKKPILFLGILIFLLVVFIFVIKKRESWGGKQFPTSCHSTIISLRVHLKWEWDLECHGNGMIVTIKDNRVGSPTEDKKEQRNILYKTLANDLTYIARNAVNGSLETTDWVKVDLRSTPFSLESITTGKQLSQLAFIKDPNLIADYLSKTVKVKEVAKE